MSYSKKSSSQLGGQQKILLNIFESILVQPQELVFQCCLIKIEAGFWVMIFWATYSSKYAIIFGNISLNDDDKL